MRLRQIQRQLLRPIEFSQRASGLDRELIVSLTSYPPRFATLHWTLRSLIRQTIKADRIILWIAEDDLPLLPEDVKRMEEIDIRPCEDFLSYKKYYFCALQYPDSYIAICDDDIYYPPEWLSELVEAVAPDTVIARRVHRRTWCKGKLNRYIDWEPELSGPEQASYDFFFTGAGGALFQPRSLDSMIYEIEDALEICRTGDDIWLNWAAYAAGTKIKKVDGYKDLISWPSSQEQSLWGDFNQTENDEMIRRVEQYVSSRKVHPYSEQ